MDPLRGVLPAVVKSQSDELHNGSLDGEEDEGITSEACDCADHRTINKNSSRSRPSPRRRKPRPQMSARRGRRGEVVRPELKKAGVCPTRAPRGIKRCAHRARQGTTPSSIGWPRLRSRQKKTMPRRTFLATAVLGLTGSTTVRADASTSTNEGYNCPATVLNAGVYVPANRIRQFEGPIRRNTQCEAVNSRIPLSLGLHAPNTLQLRR